MVTPLALGASSRRFESSRPDQPLTDAERAAIYYVTHTEEILFRASVKYATSRKLRKYRATHKRMSRWTDRWIREWLAKEAS